MLTHITVQSGGTVRLFHREYECYIAAEGSFAEDPAVVEDGRWSIVHESHYQSLRNWIVFALLL